MKLLMLLLAVLLMGCVGVVEGKGRPTDKGLPPGQARNCNTQHLQAALGGNLSTDATLAPGEELGLYATYMNWSDGKQLVNVSVTWIGDQPELRLPAEWVTFDTTQFCVQANDYRRVEIVVTVPLDASPGRYMGLFDFSVCKELICVSVAARVRLTVA